MTIEEIITGLREANDDCDMWLWWSVMMRKISELHSTEICQTKIQGNILSELQKNRTYAMAAEVLQTTWVSDDPKAWWKNPHSGISQLATRPTNQQITFCLWMVFPESRKWVVSGCLSKLSPKNKLNIVRSNDKNSRPSGLNKFSTFNFANKIQLWFVQT